MAARMQTSTKQSGDIGELIARRYLQGQGYEIIETNWRFKRLEVDIIARKGDVMVFAEVKARINSIFIEPEESVTRRKQSFLVRAAHHFLVTRDIELESRFDVISITGSREDHMIRHIKGAFSPVAK